MKKIVNSILVITIVFATFAFTAPIKKQIDIKESNIVWTGKKVIGKSHTGTIDLKEGFFLFNDDELIGGQFIIDMTSISNSDLEGEYKGKLEGHLKSDDFFGVKNHPTASFNINNVTKIDNGYEVTGDLTIKGITNTVSFDLSMVQNTSTAHLEFDRSKFNVRYGSGSFFENLGDKTISDVIELDVTLKH